LAFAVALEEISRASQTLAITLDADMTLCFLPIARFGSAEQKAKYLANGVAGKTIGAFAMSEPAGITNFGAHITKARRDGEGWVIDGLKIFCTNGEVADVFLVFARVDEAPAPTCFIVERTAPGFKLRSVERKLGWNGSGTSTIEFDGVRVGAEAQLGELHQGLLPVLQPIAESCVGIGAMCVGAAAGALAKTLSYVKDRVLGGTAVIDNQAAAHQVARAAMDIEVSRALVYQTAKLVQAQGAPMVGQPLSVLTAACKVQPPEMAARVCDTCIQLHGGHGYMTDTGIHRYWRDVRACQIGEGPTATHLDRIAMAVRAQDLI
jgi:alkylation response protein AidB-like acyl-CoA dehydrogenase